MVPTVGSVDRTNRWLDGITDSMDMSLSTLGDSEGQGSLVCCSSWVHKVSDTTEQLSNDITGLPVSICASPSQDSLHLAVR